MTLLQLVVLAVVQGITEFLPISSSGHLYLTSQVLGWPDQGILVDASVHLGTLLAVLIWCWRDVGRLFMGLFDALRLRRTVNSTLLGNLVLATIPLVIAGVVLVALDATDLFRSLVVVAWATIGFGILLWLADAFGMKLRKVEHMTATSALVIGLFQVLALIPGTSRSGITMTAARLMGFERAEAARFSLLLSIPAILAAGSVAMKDILEQGNAQFTTEVGLAVALSFLTALPAIWLMMAWLRRASFAPFVIYRIALGIALLALGYGFI